MRQWIPAIISILIVLFAFSLIKYKDVQDQHDFVENCKHYAEVIDTKYIAYDMPRHGLVCRVYYKGKWYLYGSNDLDQLYEAHLIHELTNEGEEMDSTEA